MTDSITIAGKTFNVPVRYKEGDTLSANEARALNQTYHENLRNNFAKQVKEADEAGKFDQNELQASLDDYAESYEFGQSGGGGGTRDPVASEALDIARTTIRNALKAQGKNLKDYKGAQITDAAKRYLAGPNGAKVQELAAQRVAEQKSAAADSLNAANEAIAGLAA